MKTLSLKNILGLNLLSLVLTVQGTVAQTAKPTPAPTPTPATVAPPDVRTSTLSKAIAEMDALPMSPTDVVQRADEVADGVDRPTVTDSAGWRLESAQQYYRWASWFKKQGDPASAKRAAQKALDQIASGERLSADATQPTLGAKRHELAGLIYEQVLGDTDTAQGHYTAALKLVPESPIAKGRAKNPPKPPKASGG